MSDAASRSRGPLSRARRDLLAGLTVAALLMAGGGAWAFGTRLSGAVIAAGTLTLKGSVKNIQPPVSGVVAEIAVSEGQKVAAGDLLLRLDETLARANLTIIAQQIDELTARIARLRAEAGFASEIKSDPESAARRKEETALEAIWQSEARLLAVRRTARESQKAQLMEQVAQLNEQIKGSQLQEEAKSKELELVKVELASMDALVAKKLVSISRSTQVRREATRITGELGQIRAAIATARGRISEIHVQILSLDHQAQSEAAKELREVEPKLAELRERRLAAMEQLQFTDIRAPVAGTVHELAIHTLRGYVATGDTILKIVPRDDPLVVTARVDPNDIDQVRLGQLAYLRFSAFQRETTPEVPGRVTRVSADISTDQRSGVTYYKVEIMPEPEGLSLLASDALVAGMPVEAHMQTGERTPFSYLIKPLEDQLNRAFRNG